MMIWWYNGYDMLRVLVEDSVEKWWEDGPDYDGMNEFVSDKTLG